MPTRGWSRFAPLFIAGIPAAALAVAVAVASSESSFPTPADDSTRYMLASWAEHYESLQELTDDADLVLVGAVEGPVAAHEDIQTAGRVTSSLVFTDYSVDPSEVLKGALAEGDIVVHQTGGVSADGSRLEIVDDPLLETGTIYVLFLRHNPDSNTYAVLGGPQGRLVVEPGPLSPVFSLSRLYPDREISDLAIDGLPLAAVAEEVRTATGDPSDRPK